MFLSVLALLGGLQGIIVLLLILLRFRHPKNTALALLILVFSLRLGTIPTWNAELLREHRWLWPATTLLPFLFGPLLYWCIRELSRDETAKLPLWPLHGIPFVAGLLFTLGMVATMPDTTYGDFLNAVFSGRPPVWHLVLNGLKVGINLVYVVLSFCIAFGFRSRSLAEVHRLWLRALAVVPALVLMAFMFVALDPGATARLHLGDSTPFAILAFLMTCMVYALSFLVMLAPSGLEQAGIPLKDRFSFPVSDRECQELAEQVCRRLRQGAFRDPELKEADIAGILGVHPNRVSLAVNRSFRCPFRKLLNQYRLGYFTRRVSEGALKSQSILQLALEAGFPSKSTFNRVFKEEMGITPSEYEEQMQRKPPSEKTGA